MHQDRTYRQLAGRKNLISFRVAVKETDLFVHSRTLLEPVTRELILKHRGYVENFAEQHPDFLTTLSPWHYDGPAPEIVREMISAGESAGVGPMASVAGAIAEHVGRSLLEHTGETIVENGGDVFIKLDDPFTVGIFAGESALSMRIGVHIDPKGRSVAVCTSSGTVGHSLSLGKSDAVCVVAPSCALADAAATAVGNHVKRVEDIGKGMEYAKKIEGIKGVVVIMGDQAGMWGDLELVPIGEKRG